MPGLRLFRISLRRFRFSTFGYGAREFRDFLYTEDGESQD